MRTEDALTIVSPHQKMEAWNLLKITRPVTGPPLTKSPYPVASNHRRESFNAKFAPKRAAVIRTKAEIYRIVNSFTASQYVQLQDIRFSDHKTTRECTYECNHFLSDDIRVANDQKMMILKFTPINPVNLEGNFLVYDWLSFLVSEVQMYFPDYKCVGELA
jgi:hypothetical protein